MSSRVVILGGGFAGVVAARELHRAPVDVTVVDRMNHQVFQPLLYQVAAGALADGDAASPVRAMLHGQGNVNVLMAEVTGLDVERRQLLLERGERLDYDHLIVATGAQTSYFGHDDWAKLTFGLKTLDDANRLRNHVYAAFEEAERETDEAAREAWLTFVVVGGGPTGVEVAGQLAIIGRIVLGKDFSRIDPRRARVLLLDGGDRVVPAMAKSLSAKVARYLGELGVTVRERTLATDVEPGAVTVKRADGTEERIATQTVVWAAGVRASGFAATLAAATGASTDRSGRIQVDPDLTVPGHPEIFAIGDVASLEGPQGKPLPGLATVAIQQARHAARAIREPGTSTPFRYFDKGSLAVVGREKAVCQIRGLKFGGRLAFFTYLGVHLYYLSGGITGHLRVLVAWIATRFGQRDSRIITYPLRRTETIDADQTREEQVA